MVWQLFGHLKMVERRTIDFSQRHDFQRFAACFLGAAVHKLSGHKTQVVSVSFTVDGNTAITGNSILKYNLFSL